MELRHTPTDWKDVRSHAQAVALDLKHLLEDKYMAGVREHGGNLWEKPQLLNIFQELVDAFVYLHTLRDRLREAYWALRDGTDEGRSLAMQILHQEIGGQLAYLPFGGGVKPPEEPKEDKNA